jgi:type II secretory pathway pseudopilin PulG
MTKNKLAFTLVEILITLGIIGAVAAMVLPTLWGVVEERIFENKTKQAVSLITQAAATYMANNQLYSLTSLKDCKLSPYLKACTKNLGPTLQNMVESTLKIDQKCENVEDCFSSTFTDQYGSSTNITQIVRAPASVYRLLDGYTISLRRYDSGSVSDNVSSYIFATLDINGKEEPNKLGEDLWYFMLDTTGNATTYAPAYRTVILNDVYTNVENTAVNRNCSQSYSTYMRPFCEFQRDKMNINRSNKQ